MKLLPLAQAWWLCYWVYTLADLNNLEGKSLGAKGISDKWTFGDLWFRLWLETVLLTLHLRVSSRVYVTKPNIFKKNCEELKREKIKLVQLCRNAYVDTFSSAITWSREYSSCKYTGIFPLHWLQLWESCTQEPKGHPSLDVSKYAQQWSKVYFNKHLVYIYVHVCALLYLYVCVYMYWHIVKTEIR